MSGYLTTEEYDSGLTARQVKQHVYQKYFGINLNGRDEFNDFGFGRSSEQKERVASHFAVVPEDKVFASEREGKDYVYENFQHDQQDDGYAFKVSRPSEPTKTEQMLQERIDKEVAKACEYTDKHHVRNRKSQYVGCQKCGSKLNKDYVPDDNCCPLCHNPLYSKTDMDALKRYDDNIQRWTEELDKKKANRKTETYWYAEIYHH